MHYINRPRIKNHIIIPIDIGKKSFDNIQYRVMILKHLRRIGKGETSSL
jgi:hypothetical protein